MAKLNYLSTYSDYFDSLSFAHRPLPLRNTDKHRRAHLQLQRLDRDNKPARLGQPGHCDPQRLVNSRDFLNLYISTWRFNDRVEVEKPLSQQRL